MIKSLAEDLNKTLFQRRDTNGQQIHEKVFNVTNDQGNANQNHHELYHPTSLRMAII